MKTYKRIFPTIFALTLTITMLTGCGETAETPAESKADTTTTTAEVSEPETTTTTVAPEDTTTTTTTTVAETEAPESEAEVETTTEAVESSEDTGIETMADNPEGLYPMRECFRRKVEEIYGSKVISIEFDSNYETYIATVEDGRKIAVACVNRSEYESGKIININHFYESTMDEVEGIDGIIAYAG